MVIQLIRYVFCTIFICRDSDRGVKQVFTPVMWMISTPSRFHIFFWLLANNKVLTRDNLTKRRLVENVLLNLQRD
jgi:hypothetical protein